MRESFPGRDPEDDINHRLDAVPPELPPRIVSIGFRLEAVVNLIKKLLRIKK
jgi:hypothetical protein